MSDGQNNVLSAERIERSIYRIRGQKVMLDTDLAELYGVETRVLVQAVKRNIDRFPEDFMFQLSKEEFPLWQDSCRVDGRETEGLPPRGKPLGAATGAQEIW